VTKGKRMQGDLPLHLKEEGRDERRKKVAKKRNSRRRNEPEGKNNTGNLIHENGTSYFHSSGKSGQDRSEVREPELWGGGGGGGLNPDREI